MGLFGEKKEESVPKFTVGPNGEMMLGGVQVGWEKLQPIGEEDRLKFTDMLASSDDPADILLAIRLAGGL